FFGADDAERAALFRADGVLSALAAGDGEESDVGIQAVRKIGEQTRPFIVGMSGDEEDARGDAGLVDGFDGFGERLSRGARKAGRERGRREHAEKWSDEPRLQTCM